MALFGEKDKGMPTINQFRQIEFDEKHPEKRGSELDRFILMWRDSQPGTGPPIQETTSPNIEQIDETFKVAGEVFCLVSRMMDLAATEKMFDRRDRDCLWGTIAEQEALRYPVLHGRTGENQFVYGTKKQFEQGEIQPAPTHFRLSLYPPSWWFKAWDFGLLLHVLKSLDDALQHHPDDFQMCPSCGYSFIRQRSDQEVCSARCRTRRTVKRAYKQRKLKEQLKGNLTSMYDIDETTSFMLS